MSNTYYEQELKRLRSLAREFAAAHPAVAPMLGQESADPDVERLLEGVAFLTGILHQRLNDQYPEFIQEVARVLFSQFLRPFPCSTILSFSPRGKISEPILVPKGTRAASIPVDGTTCFFETCQDLTVHPLTLTQVRAEQEVGRAAAIHLTYALTGMTLAQFRAPSLRFFLGGTYAEGSNHFHLLTRWLDRIELSAPGSPSKFLSPRSLKTPAFDDSSALFPYSPGSFSSYRLFQEFFVQPSKFLFLELDDLEQWTDRGTGNTFTLSFHLKKSPARPLAPTSQHFVLGATPAVNLYETDAEPIQVTHQLNDYPVRASGLSPGHFDIFGIETVTGTETGTGRSFEYRPFQEILGQPKSPTTRAYRVVLRPSPIERRTETCLGLLYGSEEVPVHETLSLRILATNRFLPESLKPGEITRTTDNSPERLTFTNLTAPTPYIQPPLGDELSWRVLSQLGLNFLSLADAARLRSLLSVYLFPMERNKTLEDTNKKRIESIQEVTVNRITRMIRGVLLRGSRIRIRVRGNGFADVADMVLFGSILNEFLAVYSTINSFTLVEIEDLLTGELLTWPERLGTQTLI
ncbi:MAG: type VI secretion system baseplate subunit TssF [Nitrospirae bacterium]|nr:type VI secretion system baseplate subunit TssF [Nitrospirota bacterium]